MRYIGCDESMWDANECDEAMREIHWIIEQIRDAQRVRVKPNGFYEAFSSYYPEPSSSPRSMLLCRREWKASTFITLISYRWLSSQKIPVPTPKNPLTVWSTDSERNQLVVFSNHNLVEPRTARRRPPCLYVGRLILVNGLIRCILFRWPLEQLLRLDEVCTRPPGSPASPKLRCSLARLQLLIMCSFCRFQGQQHLQSSLQEDDLCLSDRSLSARTMPTSFKWKHTFAAPTRTRDIIIIFNNLAKTIVCVAS